MKQNVQRKDLETLLGLMNRSLVTSMFKVDPEALRKHRLKQAHDNISFDSLDPEMCFEEEADENAESSGP